jgi:hypothetical protein
MAPPIPAYLVQVLTDQAPDFPTMNIAVVVIDAVTGEVGGTWSGNSTPSGILGSTCGVTP